MVGTILWWNQAKTSGLVQVVNENGEVTKYWLLESRIVQRPQQIKAGNHVKFFNALHPKRQDLLPTAIGVVVSEHPFVDSGVGALAQGASS